jgi:hypothetical protein
MKTLEKFAHLIAEISDERGNGDGIWVYLKKPYADFYFDSYSPTRQIHEQSIKEVISRLKGVRKIEPADIEECPHLGE